MLKVARDSKADKLVDLLTKGIYEAMCKIPHN